MGSRRFDPSAERHQRRATRRNEAQQYFFAGPAAFEMTGTCATRTVEVLRRNASGGPERARAHVKKTSKEAGWEEQ
jgi:hypothetical protein